jgi:anti-sigma factor RsiW
MMGRLSRLTPRDLESLSAYADGALLPAERREFDARLAQDPALRQALQQIRATSALLRSLPPVRPPRNFTLTPEMAGVRTGRPRFPVLQLATVVATLAFVVTVGVDMFGVAGSGAILRAAAPAEEMAMQAPAAMSALPTEAVAEALELGTMPTGAGTAVSEAAAMDALAATPTAASEYANREAPGVGDAGEIPPTAPDAGTAAPLLEAAAAAGGGCEACGGEMQLPPPAPQDKVVGEATPGAAVVTQEAEVQPLRPAPEETGLEARQPAGLPAVRWLELGLATVALALAAITLRTRRRAR